jgi:hypothetical protein
VSSAQFSPDLKNVVSSSWDNTAVIWPLARINEWSDVGTLVEEAKKGVPRCLTPAQSLGAFLSVEPPDWCIRMRKWPYADDDWRLWLRFSNAGLDAPLPTTAAWRNWLSAHRTAPAASSNHQKQEAERHLQHYLCDKEEKLRSLYSDLKTEISFFNKTSDVVVLYWLNGVGKRQLWKVLAPGDVFQQSTFSTYPFLIADERGTCHDIYILPSGSGRVEIEW